MNDLITRELSRKSVSGARDAQPTIGEPSGSCLLVLQQPLVGTVLASMISSRKGIKIHNSGKAESVFQ